MSTQSPHAARASTAPRVSAIAILALMLAAASSLITIVMFLGAGCVQGLEASTMGSEILRDAPVFHPIVSWLAVVLGGGSQLVAILLALWSRRRIRRSHGHLVGLGVATTALLLATLTIVTSVPAYGCGDRIMGRNSSESLTF